MKRRMYNRLYKLAASTLAAALVLSSVHVPGSDTVKAAEGGAEQQMVNIALASNGATIAATKDAESGHEVAKLIDGDSGNASMWVQNGGNWPGEVVLSLAEGNTKPIKKVVLKLEQGTNQENWAVDVTLSYSLKSDADTFIEADAKTVAKFSKGYVCEFAEELKDCAKIKVQLSNPRNKDHTNAGWWPGATELEVWAEDVMDLDLDVEARYGSNHIRWGEIDGAANYKIWRIDGTTETAVTTVAASAAHDYIDIGTWSGSDKEPKMAFTGTHYSYKVEALDASGNSLGSTAPVQDQYRTGIRALQKNAQVHYDFSREFTKSRMFDGTRVETVPIADLHGIEQLAAGTYFVSMKPTTNATAREYLFTFGTADMVFPTDNNGTVAAPNGAVASWRYLNQGYGYSMGKAWTRCLSSIITDKTKWWTFGTSVSANLANSGGGAGRYILDGVSSSGMFSDANNKDYMGFLNAANNLNAFTQMTIGGVKSGESVASAYKGEIAYITITDETFLVYNSTKNEQVAYDSALSTRLNTNVDFTALEEKLDKAEEITNNGYTSESYDALLAAIDAAATVADKCSDVTQDEVNSEAEALQAAIDGLVKEERLEVSDYDKICDIEGIGYPTAPAGKVFAGWYTDKSCKTPYMAADGRAYAKFVNEDVLSTKGQVPMNAGEITSDNDAKTRLRLVSTIDDCLDYKKVGFHIKYTYNGTNFDFDTVSAKVYNALYDVDGIDAIVPTDIDEESEYFFTYSITSIPYEAFDTSFEVKAYWITKDGTKVYGASRAGEDALSVNKGIDKNQEVSR